MTQKLKIKILIAEDEALIRRSLKIAGESRGHIVQTAENGLLALSVWDAFKPDLAIIDVLMPEMDGLELLKQIPKNSSTKIIVISAHDEMSKDSIKHTKADLFIKKPFKNIFKLIQTGEQLLDKNNTEPDC